MTICNKIQTLGETMETNLNARGVSCTFGTGTGESTVLEMVEMVNGTNFKGSSDVNLKIGANRPYLLTGETTDVIVRLEDGLCEPLKNKNVIVGQSVFRDGGVTNNHNTKWWATGTLNITTSSDGTLVKNENSSGYSLDYSYVTDNFPSSWADRENAVTCYHRPFVVEFDLVSVSSTSDVGLFLGDGSANVHTYFYNLGLNVGHIRIEVSTTQVKCYLDETLVSTNNLSDSVTLSRVGFRVNANSNLKYKNFVVYENITGVTDEKGEFALYDVSVTDDTTFTATYGTETATCLVEYCSFVDYGITSKHNDNWVNYNNYLTVTRNDMYTTLTPTVNYSQNRYILPNVPTQPFVIEFDKHNTSMAGAYLLIGNVTIQFSTSFSGRLANAKHLKFTIQDNKVTCEHDGVVEQTQMNLTSLNDGIRFQINNNNDGNVIQYKNFRVR